MSMDKAIRYGKEKRKIYRGSKSVDCTCRNHGSCSYCKSNRMYQYNKEVDKSISKIKDMDLGGGSKYGL